jgi:Flp pilus assembly pilin Flp
MKRRRALVATPTRLARLARRLVCDERGGEILEYVLIAGLIIAATVAVIAAFGARVLARWSTVSDSSL